MKRLIIPLVTVVIFSLTSLKAEARPARKSAPSTVTASDIREPAGDRGATRFGLGFATYGGPPQLGGILVNPSISGWIDFSPLMSIQITAAIASSSPFQFGLGGAFRYTLHGSQADGFHVGFGFNLGTIGNGAAAIAAGGGSTTFYLQLVPMFGYHFALGGALSNLQLAFDGGPVLAVTPSPFQFEILPISMLLGASIHYFF